LFNDHKKTAVIPKPPKIRTIKLNPWNYPIRQTEKPRNTNPIFKFRTTTNESLTLNQKLPHHQIISTKYIRSDKYEREREDLKAKRHKNRRQGRKRWNPERLSVVTAELPFPQKSDLPSLRNNQGINITTPLPNFYSYLGLAFLRCDVFFFADADGHDGPLVGHPSRGHAR
jgi:hypothetical protein